MYYWSGTVELTASQWCQSLSSAGGQPMDTAAASDGQTSWPPSSKYHVMSEIWLSQWMHIYLKNNPAKFHPGVVWNNGALGFFDECCHPRRRTTVRIWDHFLIESVLVVISVVTFVMTEHVLTACRAWSSDHRAGETTTAGEISAGWETVEREVYTSETTVDDTTD